MLYEMLNFIALKMYDTMTLNAESTIIMKQPWPTARQYASIHLFIRE
jgi:hypothetical protein